MGPSPVAVRLDDLRDNGKLDIVTSNTGDNTVSVLLGNGDGTFEGEVAYDVGRFPAGVAVGEVTFDTTLDGQAILDAIPDIVTANRVDGTISVLEGDGFRVQLERPGGDRTVVYDLKAAPRAELGSVADVGRIDGPGHGQTQTLRARHLARMDAP